MAHAGLPAGFAETLAEDAAEAVIFADRDGIIRFWNAGAERIFGFAPADALGQSLDLVIPEGLRPRHWEGYRATMASGKSRYRDGDLLSVPGLRRDGTRISLEFSILPFRDTAGAMLGVAAILRDVTARFEEMKALRRRLAALEREPPAES